MKKINFTKRFGLLKIALTLSLMLLFTAPLLAQGGGMGRHHHNDSIPPPPPPPPPPHWNDSLPPPPPPYWNDSVPPPHWGDTTRHNWNDSVPPPPPPHWNDSVPPPQPPHWCDTTRHFGNDSIAWNDSLPPPRHWNDSIRWDTTRHCDGGDSIGVNRIQNKANVNIYPNPIVETAKMHIENTSGNLTFNLYGLSGRLVLTLPNLTNGDVQLNNSGLIPGIYIYELRNANSIVSTGRVLIE
jgi:hypothetical protein